MNRRPSVKRNLEAHLAHHRHGLALGRERNLSDPGEGLGHVGAVGHLGGEGQEGSLGGLTPQHSSLTKVQVTKNEIVHDRSIFSYTQVTLHCTARHAKLVILL